MKRNSNIEFLRIILMVLIILWHFLVYGCNIFDNYYKSDYELYSFLYPILVFPVDCFIFISGYYGLKLNKRKLISLIVLLVTYSFFINIIKSYIYGVDIDIKLIIMSLFPISTNYWWFFTQYFMLLILSPLINVCDNWSRSFFKKMLVLYAIFYLGLFSFLFGQKIGCTADLPHFIFVYLLARYLSKYPIPYLIKRRYFIFIVLYITTCLLIYSSIKFNKDTYFFRMISYNNPLIIFIMVEIFYIFKFSKIKYIRYINVLASTVFASYIITESSLRELYIQTVMNIAGNKLIFWIIFALITILIISPLEILRNRISNKIINIILREK